LTKLASSKLDTEDEIQALERLGLAAGRLADWLEEEQVNTELDDVKCAMICEALGEAVGKHTM
jgi:hypothetical protein